MNDKTKLNNNVITLTEKVKEKTAFICHQLSEFKASILYSLQPEQVSYDIKTENAQSLREIYNQLIQLAQDILHYQKDSLKKRTVLPNLFLKKLKATKNN